MVFLIEARSVLCAVLADLLYIMAVTDAERERERGEGRERERERESERGHGSGG